jgi:hypothetical protein
MMERHSEVRRGPNRSSPQCHRRAVTADVFRPAVAGSLLPANTGAATLPEPAAPFPDSPRPAPNEPRKEREGRENRRRSVDRYRATKSAGGNQANLPSKASSRPFSAPKTCVEKPRKRTDELRGFIAYKLPTSEAGRRLFDRLFAEYDAPSQRFVMHLLLCGSTGVRQLDEFWVPISWLLIRREVRQADIDRLERDGFIEVDSTYDRFAGRSREYRIALKFIERWIELQPRTVAERQAVKMVDFLTGKRTGSVNKTLVADEQRNTVFKKGSIGDQAFRTLKKAETPFLPVEIEKHLEAMRSIEEAAEKAWLASGEAMHTEAFLAHRATFEGTPGQLRKHERTFDGDRYTKPYGEYLRAKYRRLNDEMCFISVLNQNPVPAPEIGPGVWKVIQPYRAQMSGRVGIIGGGLQTCSREMKMAAFSRVPGLRNWDLKGSQPAILIRGQVPVCRACRCRNRRLEDLPVCAHDGGNAATKMARLKR